MPFLSERHTKPHTKRKAIILRMYHPHESSNSTFYPQQKPIKRVSRSASCFSMSKEQENPALMPGAMTVEAAAAVPIFLCFMINVLSIMLFFHVFISNLEDLHQQGRQLSMLAYSAGDITEQNGEMIELVKPVRIRPPLSLIGYPGSTVVSCCYMRAWTGYDVTDSTGMVSAEEYVYLTDNGSVYHRKESCTHLALSIEMTARANVDKLRNESGRKYVPCEKCGGEGSILVYVAREGDCYHNTITCSGLKRSIRRVPLADAAGLPACGRCG